jgi:ABC-2 type transport system ATP-binding protein
MNTNAIEIRGLVKKYPAFQLGPLDLTVPRGAIYGLIGPNGAGKTTAIDMIFGMGRKPRGTVGVHALACQIRQAKFRWNLGKFNQI